MGAMGAAEAVLPSLSSVEESGLHGTALQSIILKLYLCHRYFSRASGSAGEGLR